MPTCQNCKRECSWQQTFKKMFLFNTRMKCPHCGTKQYYTKRARTRMSVLIFLIPFIIFLTLFDIPFFLLIGIHLLFCLSIMAIFPFLIELSNEEEPFW